MTQGGAGSQRWNPRGSELLYGSLRGEVMSVAVVPGPNGPTIGVPRRLFSAIGPTNAGVSNVPPFEIGPDGRRLLIGRSPAGLDVSRSPLIVTLNRPAIVKAGQAAPRQPRRLAACPRRRDRRAVAQLVRDAWPPTALVEWTRRREEPVRTPKG